MVVSILEDDYYFKPKRQRNPLSFLLRGKLNGGNHGNSNHSNSSSTSSDTSGSKGKIYYIILFFYLCHI